MKYHFLVVEDDECQRNNLKKMLAQISEEFVIHEADSMKVAEQQLQKYPIDLFYLDHHLPDGSGIELGRKIRAIPRYKLTWIIFCTVYVNYMIEAFKETHCYDYILKPYSGMEVKELTLELIKGLQRGRKASSTNDNPSIDFRIGSIRLKLFTEQIHFIEVKIRTCYIHAETGIYPLKRMTLKQISSQLPPTEFLQCHRSFLVNVNHIHSIYEERGEWKVSFENEDQTAIIGKTYKSNFLQSVDSGSLSSVL